MSAMPERRPVSVESLGNDGFRYEPAPERTPPDDTTPKRIQRSRAKGWRMPGNAVYVGRPTRWGNPFTVGKTLVRYPGIDGAEWEHEGRSGKTPGEQHAYKHPDGSVTWHRVEVATREQVVELYSLHTGPMGSYELDSEDLERLRGRDLACWCPLDVPCHADVLLEIANRETSDA